MPAPSRRALQLQAGATSRSSQSRSVNQANFLAELHTRTDEQAALEEQANEEFHEEMQRQAQERDLKVSALAVSGRRKLRRFENLAENPDATFQRVISGHWYCTGLDVHIERLDFDYNKRTVPKDVPLRILLSGASAQHTAKYLQALVRRSQGPELIQWFHSRNHLCFQKPLDQAASYTPGVGITTNLGNRRCLSRCACSCMISWCYATHRCAVFIRSTQMMVRHS